MERTSVLYAVVAEFVAELAASKESLPKENHGNSYFM